MTLGHVENSRVSKNDYDFAESCVSVKKNAFSAKKFVDDLMKHGSKVPCDNSTEEFKRDGLPNWFDDEKYKRGQDFYQNNRFALSLCKFFGLLVTLSSPTILAVLIMTKMSGNVMTAYRRYVATIFYVNLWYDCELTPDSKSMKSLKRVKAFHNSASFRSRGLEKPPITQEDMVLTQFGFVGFCISRREFLGIHKATREDLEGFVHFWRVIGSIIGIQDRFNLCRDSLEETTEICEEILNRILRPSVGRKDKNFLDMTRYLTNGLWHIDPQLNFRVFMTFMYDVMKPKECLQGDLVDNSDRYFELNFLEIFYYRLVCFICYVLKFDLVRYYYNLQHRVSLWIVHRFPFLAVYAFGYKNAMVSIENIGEKSD